MFGPGGVPLGPTGCLIAGGVLVGVGFVEITIATLRPKWWMRRRWLHARWGCGNTSGAPVSRFGGLAQGLFFAALGVSMILNGYLGVLTKSSVIPIMFAAFGLVVIAGLVDSWKHKRRGPMTRRS